MNNEDVQRNDMRQIQLEAMRKYVLTDARIARKDVAEFQGKNGGVLFKAPSYLDVLLDNGTITESQYGCGMIYWGLRETAFHYLGIAGISYDYKAPPDGEIMDSIETYEESAEQGASTEIFMLLGKRMAPIYKKAIEACCVQLESNYLPTRMAIYWAFNESALSAAFEQLERIYPLVKDEALAKLQKAVIEVA